MKWSRRFLSLGLILALSAGVSCTTADSPTAPAAATQADEQQTYLLGNLFEGDGLLSGDGLLGDAVTGVVGSVLQATDLLTCTPQPYEVVRKTIGYQGGTIAVGNHVLVIPRGALRQNTVITAEQIPGRTNSVRFGPEGLQFEQPAGLVMNYKNCLLVVAQKRIVYTDEKLNILEVLRSLDLFKSRTVAAPIDHFSRYVVAY